MLSCEYINFIDYMQDAVHIAVMKIIVLLIEYITVSHSTLAIGTLTV